MRISCISKIEFISDIITVSIYSICWLRNILKEKICYSDRAEKYASIADFNRKKSHCS